MYTRVVIRAGLNLWIRLLILGRLATNLHLHTDEQDKPELLENPKLQCRHPPEPEPCRTDALEKFRFLMLTLFQVDRNRFVLQT